ncbi:neuroglobin-like [Trichogramma pretiosum]|uniref:neuroglobin-like n=1 Tax=Trichogramma pretiosum TaxID=7493 RepID=UPI0006C9D10A|nr:neuroglobin-like [Trichogramma pretiosum]
MGCKLGKLTFSRTIRDSHLNQESPPLPPATDPRLPLTARQKYILSASWKAIAKAIEPTGIYMFIRLFEENEELLKMFDKLKHLKTREEQFDSPELAEHAQKVMNTLDEGIQGLDDLDVFLDFLHQIGASHSKIPGFQSDFFWKIQSPFLAAMQMTLHDRYTDNVENIYKLTIQFIIQTLIDGYNEATKTKDKEKNGPS